MKQKLCSILSLALFIAIVPLPGHSQDPKPITPEEAAKFFHQSMTVCGRVVSPKHAEKSKGQPTFLYLDQPYPNHIFTIVIWGSDRGKFEKTPETMYDDQDVCGTGLIVEHKGKPQLVVRNPSQIAIR